MKHAPHYQKAARLVILRSYPQVRALGLTERAKLFNIDNPTAWRDMKELSKLERAIEEIERKVIR